MSIIPEKSTDRSTPDNHHPQRTYLARKYQGGWNFFGKKGREHRETQKSMGNLGAKLANL